MIDYYQPNIDLTLLGCGFLGSYHLGAIQLLQQIWPQRAYNKICGASCGSLLASLILAGVRLDVVLSSAMGIIRQLRACLLKPTKFVAVNDLVLATLHGLLPDDAHLRCSDKLGISITKLQTLENKFISQFRSRQDLIDAIAAGCFIPIWSGSIHSPKYQGEGYIDGAYSDNMPKFELTKEDISTGVRQVTVSPFACDAQVAPRDTWALFSLRILGTIYLFNWNNIVRTQLAMMPSAINRYKPHLIAGHTDMKDFVLRSKLIRCVNCCKVDPRLPCLSCLKLLERVDSLKVPERLLQLMEG